MKKFFRLVSVFAIAGAALAYTGCTDYSEDIDAVNKRVDGTESSIADVKSQLSNLQSTVNDLTAAKDAADKAIKGLEADVAALQTDLQDLETKLSALEGKHDKDVKAINASIDAINATIDAAQKAIKALEGKVAAIEAQLPDFAKKTWVEATFATKAAVAEINTAVGKLQADLELANAEITKLAGLIAANAEAIAANKEAIEDNAEAIAANAKALEAANALIAKNTKAIEVAQAAAEAAQATADNALGKVETLIEALGVYAEKGKLEEKIMLIDLTDKEQDAAIKKLQEEKLNIADFQGKFDAAFDKAIKAAVAKGGIVEVEIARQVKEAKDALQAQIDVINGKINKIFGLIEGRITNLTIVPDAYCMGVPVIMVKSLYYTAGTKTKWISSNDYATVKYRIAPKAAGIDNASFDFVGDKATEHMMSDTRATYAAAPKAPIALSDGVENPITFDATTGYATFTVKKVADLREGDPEFDIVALEATIADELLAEGEKDAKVYSEYAKVQETAIYSADLFVSDKAKLLKNTDCHYVQTLADAKALVNGNVGFYTFNYNEVFDLKALVATCFHEDGKHTNFDIDEYNLHYEFFIDTYSPTSGSTVTPQEHMIAMKKGTDKFDGVFVTVDKNGVESSNKEAVGRTPIIRVELVAENGDVVRKGYVKVLVTVPHAADKVITNLDNDYITDLCFYDTKKVHKYEFNEKRMWEEIYQFFNMNHEEFWTNYELSASTVTITGSSLNTMASVPQIIDGVTDEGVATKKVVWSFTENEVGCIKGDFATINAELKLANKHAAFSELPMQVIFKFQVKAYAPEYNKISDSFTYERLDRNFWNGEVLVANVAVPASTNDVAANCQFNTPFGKAPWKVAPKVNFLPACYSFQARIKSVYPAAAKAGVSLSEYAGEQSIALDKANAAVKAALDKDELSAIIEYYVAGPCNKEISLLTFKVDFIRPVYFQLPTDRTVIDAQDGGDKVVDFDMTGLFTDWRGAAVFPANFEWGAIKNYGWVRTGNLEKTYVPASQKLVSEAWDEYIFGEKEYKYTKEVTATGDVIVAGSEIVKASVKVVYSRNVANAGILERIFDPTWTRTQVLAESDVQLLDFVGYGATSSEAAADLRANMTVALGSDLTGHAYDPWWSCGIGFNAPIAYENITTEGAISTGSVTVENHTITFTTIVDVKHHPAVYEEIPEKWVVNEDDQYKYNVAPSFRFGAVPFGTDLTEGFSIDYWTWKRMADIPVITVERPQQYWDFYGVFSNIVLDIENLYTDLNTKKLPSTVTLTQVGNTVVFHNNGSPVMEEYHITIPATVTYGWGTLKSNLVITVLPLQN